MTANSRRTVGSLVVIGLALAALILSASCDSRSLQKVSSSTSPSTTTDWREIATGQTALGIWHISERADGTKRCLLIEIMATSGTRTARSSCLSPQDFHDLFPLSESTDAGGISYLFGTVSSRVDDVEIKYFDGTTARVKPVKETFVYLNMKGMIVETYTAYAGGKKVQQCAGLVGGRGSEGSC